MRLEINRTEGLRNDLLLRLERTEIQNALLSVAHRESLRGLAGMPRHRQATEAEMGSMAASKILIEDHLRRLEITDAAGRAAHRAIAISNRNLGTNHGHLAWQRSESPRIFRILEDPVAHPVHSCLVAWRDARISVEDMRFDRAGDRLYRAATAQDVSDQVEWATFGQRVLRDGQVCRIETIIDQFYDLRHVLAFDQNRSEGEQIRRGIYAGYPAAFRTNALRAWSDQGVPRARYFHNAIGVSRTAVFIVQREGTVEEIAAALAHAGAEEGIILDNGGSVVCWAWWVNNYAGGVLSPTVDYRPPGTSAIAFVLKGPLHVDMPGGSVSYSVS